MTQKLDDQIETLESRLKRLKEQRAKRNLRIENKMLSEKLKKIENLKKYVVKDEAENSIDVVRFSDIADVLNK